MLKALSVKPNQPLDKDTVSLLRCDVSALHRGEKNVRTLILVGLFAGCLLQHVWAAPKSQPKPQLEGYWTSQKGTRLIHIAQKANNRYLLKDVYPPHTQHIQGDRIAEVYPTQSTTPHYIGRTFHSTRYKKRHYWRSFGGFRIQMLSADLFRAKRSYGKPTLYRRYIPPKKGTQFPLIGLWREKKNGWLIWIKRHDQVSYVTLQGAVKHKFSKHLEVIAQFHARPSLPNTYIGRHKWGSSKIGKRTFWGRFGGYQLRSWGANRLSIRYLDSSHTPTWQYVRVDTKTK